MPAKILVFLFVVFTVSQSNVESALVRTHIHQGGYSTDLFDGRACGIYQTNPSQAATVTYGWWEGEQSKFYSELVPAGSPTHEFRVSTGPKIADEFVRIQVE